MATKTKKMKAPEKKAPEQHTHESASTATIPVEDLTDAQKFRDLYVKHEAMVNVLNNVIGYLNTLEQWRTASFKPKEEAQTAPTTGKAMNADEMPPAGTPGDPPPGWTQDDTGKWNPPAGAPTQ